MIADWARDTAPLLNQISEWSHQNGWTVEPEVTLHDLPDSNATLDVQGLRIIPSNVSSKGRIHLEPLGRRADGKVVVEMYAWPTLIRVHLVQAPGSDKWEVFTDTGIPFYWDWNKTTFTRLIHDLQVVP